VVIIFSCITCSQAYSSDDYLLGTWEASGAAGRAIWGVMEIQDRRILWGTGGTLNCSADYEIDYSGKGVNYPDVSATFREYKRFYYYTRIVLTGHKCEGTGDPNKPQKKLLFVVTKDAEFQHNKVEHYSVGAVVIEYDNSGRPVGWLSFSNKSRWDILCAEYCGG